MLRLYFTPPRYIHSCISIHDDIADELMRKVLAVCCILGALLGGYQCRAADAGQSTITVFGAASLTNVLQDLGDAFTKETSVTVKFSFAASSALAHQIENGGTGGRVLLRGSRLDGLPAKAKSDPDAFAARRRREPPVLIAPVASALTLKSSPISRWRPRSARAVWQRAIPTRSPSAAMRRRH